MPTGDGAKLDLTGQVLEGRYRVEGMLGRGGMGSVYLARDERMQRKVVVKVPHARFLDEPGFRERFEKEILSLTTLEHPHIVKALDAGVVDGVPYAVLQYLPGGSLRDRITNAGGRLPPSDVAAWLPAIAQALDFIHREEVVHRDVKPGNVLFDRDGNVFLADFGIAKALGAADTGLTQTGATPGSPDYMAPEVSIGGTLGPAYDQYALATLVYEALAGGLPHGAQTSPFQMLYRKASQPPAPLSAKAPHVPAAAADAVMRALSMKPEDRFSSNRAFADAFVAGLEPAAVPSPPPRPERAPVRAASGETLVVDEPAGPAAPSGRAARARTKALALLGLLVAGGGAFMLLRTDPKGAGGPERAGRSVGAVPEAAAPTKPPPAFASPLAEASAFVSSGDLASASASVAAARAQGASDTDIPKSVLDAVLAYDAARGAAAQPPVKAPTPAPEVKPVVAGPPSLLIEAPEDRTISATKTVRVAGAIQGALGGRLTVNDQDVEVRDGRFDGVIEAGAEGDLPLRFSYQVEKYLPVTGTRTIRVDATAPVVEIRQPGPEVGAVAESKLALKLLLTDANPAALLVNAKPVGMSPGGDADLAIDLPADGSEVPVAIEAKDLAGHATTVRRVYRRDPSGRTSLHAAVEADDLAAVKGALDRGVPVNATTSTGQTALRLAYEGDVAAEVIGALLDAGADPKLTIRVRDGRRRELGEQAVSLERFAPLHAAALWGDVALVRRLLTAGADPDAEARVLVRSRGEDRAWVEPGVRRAGVRALHLTALTANADVAKALLEKGARPELEDERGWTPIFDAAATGRPEVVALLLAAKADPNDKVSGLSLLAIAAKSAEGEAPDGPRIDVVRLLLDAGADPVSRESTYEPTPLHHASRRDVALALVEKGAPLEALHSGGRLSPLFSAAAHGAKDVVEFLIERGADVTRAEAGWTLLHSAAEAKTADVARMLVAKGFDPRTRDADGRSPLFSAAESGCLDSVRLLLDGGADPKAKDGYGRTPLHLAARCVRSDVAALLLEKGADPAAREGDGTTPLYYAAQSGRLETVRLLLGRGADLKSLDVPGRSVLAAAASSGKIEVVRALLDAGFDVKAAEGAEWGPLVAACGRRGNGAVVALLLERGADPKGRAGTNTPLHAAAAADDVPTVTRLLDAGAAIEALNESGYTPLLEACRAGAESTAALLLSRGASAAAVGDYETGAVALAARAKSEELAQLLASKGASTATKAGWGGGSPLYDAASAGSTSVVAALIASHADLEAATNRGDTPLLAAAAGGHADAALALLAAGAKATAVNAAGKSALHLATGRRGAEVARALLERGCPIDARDDDGRTPLHAAAEAGNVDLLRVLLDKGAKSEVASYGLTPLHLAALKSAKAVALLLEHAAPIDAKDYRGVTPLLAAAEKGPEEVGTVLLDRGANMLAASDDGFNALQYAASRKSDGWTRLLLARNFDPNATTSWRSALRCAAVAGAADSVRLLLEKGASPSEAVAVGETPLFLAAGSGSVEAVRLLLAKGADIRGRTRRNKEGTGEETALHRAARYGSVDTIRLLLDQGADVAAVDQAGETPLHEAAEAGSAERAAALLERGAKVDALDRQGRPPILRWGGGTRTAIAALVAKGSDPKSATKSGDTPLHMAARAGDLTAVEALLSKGALVDAKDEQGETPLLLAAKYRRWDVARTLLARGASVKAQSKADGQTPLHRMLGSYDEARVGLLGAMLDAGADVTAKDSSGRTPLHVACANEASESRRLIEALLAKGADVRARDAKGRTPLFDAVGVRTRGIVELLLARGADPKARAIDKDTPVHAAVERPEQLRLLLEKGGDPSAVGANGDAPLYRAAGELVGAPVVRLLIERRVDVNARNAAGRTALHAASRGADRSTSVRLLLAAGAAVGTTDNEGSSALFEAARSPLALEALLAAGADVTSRDAKRDTILLRIAREGSGHAREAMLCLDRGADLKAKDKDGATALHLAAEHGDFPLARALLDRGAEIGATRADGSTPLLVMSPSARPYLFALLLDRGADVNARRADGTTILHRVADENELASATVLLDRGADANAKRTDGKTPLDLAVDHYRFKAEFLTLLLDRGADPKLADAGGATLGLKLVRDGHGALAVRIFERIGIAGAKGYNGGTLLHEAGAKAGNGPLAALLLARGVAVDARDDRKSTPLHRAAGGGAGDVMQVLLEKGADLEATNEYGYTPLARAADEGRSEAFHMLLSRGAKLVTLKGQRTLVHLAARGGTEEAGRLKILETLVGKGYKVTAVDENGNTPLHDAWLSASVSRFLLDHGADVNAIGQFGRTSLSDAANAGDVENVAFLLSRGADPFIKDQWGQTALDRASGPGDMPADWRAACADLLRKAMAAKKR